MFRKRDLNEIKLDKKIQEMRGKELQEHVKEQLDALNNPEYLPPSTEPSNVNSPSHYNSGKIEVIDYIEDQNLGFSLGNAIKYISRAGKKNPQHTNEDLRKAIWYIERYIETLNLP